MQDKAYRSVRRPPRDAVLMVMAPRSTNDTDPMGQPALDPKHAEERSAAAEVTDPDPRAIVPYELPVDDPRIQSIFDNMETRRAPPPIDSPVTNGDLAAAYASPATTIPARNPTPAPQPAVMVDATPLPQPPLPRTTQPLPVVQSLPIQAPPPPHSHRNAPTVRIERPVEQMPAVPISGRMFLIVGLVGGALAATVVFVALSVLRGDSTSKTNPAATVALPPATAAPMPIPTHVPFVPPPPASTIPSADAPTASRPGASVPLLIPSAQRTVRAPSRSTGAPTAPRSGAPAATATAAQDVHNLDLLRQ